MLFSLLMLPFKIMLKKKIVVASNQITPPPPPPKIMNIKRLFSLFQLTVLVTTQELDRDLAMYYSLDFFVAKYIRVYSYTNKLIF